MPVIQVVAIRLVEELVLVVQAVQVLRAVKEALAQAAPALKLVVHPQEVRHAVPGQVGHLMAGLVVQMLVVVRARAMLTRKMKKPIKTEVMVIGRA